MKSMPSETLARIRQMEQYFDVLCTAAQECPETLHSNPALREMLHALIRYYESGLWLRDYELDEQGGLPTGLKRGVLSQDGVFNLLARICPAAEAEDSTS